MSSRNRGIFLILSSLFTLALAGCSSDSPTNPLTAPGIDAVSRAADKGLPPGAGEVLPGRYIVRLEPGKRPVAALATDLAKRNGFAVQHLYSSALRGFSAGMTAEQAAALAAENGVLGVEPDRPMQAFAEFLPTGVDREDVERNPYSGIDGVSAAVDVDIAIIDTGIDPDHPDLNVVGGVKLLGGTSDPDFRDGFGHGTHCAGIAAARNDGQGVVGVAPGARLWAVKVLNDSGSGSMSDIIAGVDWVAARADEIEVINMSLGGFGWSDALRSAIQGCVGQGVVVAVAAGNYGMDVYGFDRTIGNWDDQVPAAIPEAMTVSALADGDGLPGGLGAATSSGADDSFASFSNTSHNVVAGNPVNSPGAAIDLMLPGVDIISSVPGGGYAALSGTSMASPHAAGLAALYIAQHGRAADAAGVYAIRQALIDQGAPQNSPWGLAAGGDRDGNIEPIGMAAPLAAFSDLGFRSFRAQASIHPGDTVHAKVALGNRGTSAVTGPVTLRMFESGSGTEVTTPRVLSSGLAVGQSITSAPHIRTPADLAPGTYTLVVQHDLGDDVGFNDSMSLESEVLPPAMRRPVVQD